MSFVMCVLIHVGFFTADLPDYSTCYDCIGLLCPASCILHRLCVHPRIIAVSQSLIRKKLRSPGLY